MFSRLTTVLSNLCTIKDEPWQYTEEPHISRRREMLKKHPEIKDLMGYDSSITYIAMILVGLQLCMFWIVRDMAWGPLFVISYVVGGSLNASLGAAIHEVSHNLAYGHKHHLWNKVLGIICNLPLGVPASATFKKFHSNHHRYLCNPELDIAIPSFMEYSLFSNPVTRILCLLAHPVFQVVRPFQTRPIPTQKLEIVNLLVQLVFDVAIVYCCGPKSLFYAIAGTALGVGLHPLAGHYLTAHYMFTDGLASASCYSPLNLFLFNIGYHVEHHDFPNIPWRRLPEVRRIAPEFYDELPQHKSWLFILWTFIITGPQGYAISDMVTMEKKDEKPELILEPL